MSKGRGLERSIVDELSSRPLRRSTRSHLGILKELSERNQRQWEIGELKRELRKKYGSTENVIYHFKLLREDGLVARKGSTFYLTAYAYSLLSQPNLDKLVGERGLEEVDLLLLLELLNARTRKRKFALRPLDISTRIGSSVESVYKSGSQLQKRGLVKGWSADELPKLSQRMYRLTDDGREACRNAICGAIASRIISEYQPPRWVSIAELMNRRQQYPESVQRLIERSFGFLSANAHESSDLCRVTYNMFPWLEQMNTDFVMENYMKGRLEQEKDSTGFRIDRRFILTGSETVSSFVKQRGARIILFALESLHLEEAKPIVDNSLLVGGMEGPMAYCVVGVGKKYKKAICEAETLYSKKLVMDVAKKYNVRESQIDSVSGHGKYLKVIDNEAYNDAIFSVKTPFGAVMKTQFQDATVLARVPIVLGVFVFAEEDVGISAAIKLSRIIHESIKILGEPRVYGNAVLDYVHRLPKIDRSFNKIHVVSELEKCGVNTHAGQK